MSALQAFNIIIPLVSVPYAVRVIGAEYFGLINFAAAFAGFFIIISDYGFNFTANRDIAKNRNDRDKCMEIFNSVLTLKLLLLLLSVLIFVSGVFLFPGIFYERPVFFISLGTLAGMALFPQWFFKGMEKMLYVTVPGIVIRAAATLLVFFAVREKSDYVVYALLLNGGNFLLGITGILIVAVKFRYKFYFPSRRVLWKDFREGLEVFYSIICTSVYGYANTFILGLFSDLKVVGFYAASDKIVSGIVGIISNLNESTYPRISSLLVENREKGVEMIKMSAKIIGTVSLSFSFLLFIFAKPLVLVIFGDEFASTVPLLRIMSLIPLFLPLNNLLGVQTILNMGYKKDFLRIISASLLFFLTVSFTLVPFFRAEGTAIAITGTELLVLLLMALFVKRKKLLNYE
ncbi:MAG: oligosaccharide flippase family protein [Bacteroidetes bacterium]|nr:oligosaccharide flippase family protein [Bacteroidota bacterium]